MDVCQDRVTYDLVVDLNILYNVYMKANKINYRFLNLLQEYKVWNNFIFMLMLKIKAFVGI